MVLSYLGAIEVVYLLEKGMEITSKVSSSIYPFLKGYELKELLTKHVLNLITRHEGVVLATDISYSSTILKDGDSIQANYRIKRDYEGTIEIRFSPDAFLITVISANYSDRLWVKVEPYYKPKAQLKHSTKYKLNTFYLE